MRDYITVEKQVDFECLIRKSRFICSVAPVTSLGEGIVFLKKIKDAFKDATHYCYSIIGLPDSNEEKNSDDGEPSGTAGLPIKSILNKNGLQGIACVVTRYFGGIKLGAPGLVSAYSGCVSSCLKTVLKINMLWSIVYMLRMDYSDAEIMLNKVQPEDFVLIESSYSDKVELKIGVPMAKKDVFFKLTESITSGKLEPEMLFEKYIGYRR